MRTISAALAAIVARTGTSEDRTSNTAADDSLDLSVARGRGARAVRRAGTAWPLLVGVLATCAGSCSPTHPKATVESEGERALAAVHASFSPQLIRPGLGRATAMLTGGAVHLPATADGAVRIEHQGVGVAVRLSGARAVAGQLADGVVVYPGGAPEGGDVFQRVDATGTEDFVRFDHPPPRGELRYALTLAGVAGLRLVDDTLELLDASGTPQLRATAPFLIDATHARRPARLELEGCVVDRDPAPPWGRTVTSPGSSSCTLVVSFDAGSVVYPALLDPAWTATSVMARARYAGTATLLANKKVLVAGGRDALDGLKPAELYDETTNSFAATGSLTAGREAPSAVRLLDGRVLLAGGFIAGGPTPAVEIYQPTGGTWTTVKSMLRGRGGALTVLTSGKVLATGGYTVVSVGDSACEVYDPALDTWTATGSTTIGDRHPATTLLADGRVLGVINSTADLYDATTGKWTPTGAPAEARIRHAQVRLADGRVLVAGGLAPGSTLARSTTEIWDKGTWSFGPNLSDRRWYFDAVTLTGGTVLLAGGASVADFGTTVTTAEIFDPTTNMLTPTASLIARRAAYAASILPTGKVLVAGGSSYSTGPLSTAEVFSASPNGTPCSVGGACVSGFCVDGVCCDSACTGTCRACSAAKKGSGTDGTCAAVASGTDPDGDCPDDGSPSCARDGKCDGAGACRNYPTATGCTPSGCTADAECASGHCVEGVCCNEACASPCKSCLAVRKGGGANGVCGNVPADTNPKGGCLPDLGFPASCKADGFCDGAGSCRVHAKSGTECGAPACSAGNLTTSQCNGSGACTISTVACSPFSCKDGKSCAGGCSSDAACDAKAYCAPEGCVAKKANGAAATAGRECLSGIVADGVCCGTLCGGQCEACAEPSAAGTCVAIAGAPRAGGTECPVDTADNPCKAAKCDGSERLTCAAFVGTDVTCRKPSCKDGVALAEGLCTGKGTCGQTDPLSCGGFACGDVACKSRCEKDADCASGHTCAGGLCIRGAKCSPDGTKLVDVSGKPTDCAPFKCQGDRCLDACTDSSECQLGNSCDPDTRRCVSAAPPPGDSPCSSTRSRGGPAGVLGTLMALTALSGVLRRRRTR